MSGPECKTCLDAKWLYEAGDWIRCPDCVEPPAPIDMNGLGPFIHYSEIARAEIPESKTDWSGSPFAWMLSNGPPTKSKMAKTIVREWLKTGSADWEDAESGDAHFLIGRERVVVHLGMQGVNGKLEFANLRGPGLGIDYMLFIGVEPRRARIWQVLPEVVVGFHSYSNDAEGYHNTSFDPEDIPDWATELVRWP